MRGFARVSAAVPAARVADFEANSFNILALWREADAQGSAVVVYPEQVWYGGVTASDAKEIVERHILKGEYVERLLIPGQDHDSSTLVPLVMPATEADKQKA